MSSSFKSIHHTDVLIVGAGPVGLFAIFECGMLRLKCHIVDTLADMGGQCTALYPEKPIYDIPGFPKIQASELIDRLYEQARPFSPVFHLDQQLVKLEQTENRRWLAETSWGTTIECGAVIIAGGVGSFGPNRPPMEGIEQFEGKNVFYYVSQPQMFDEKTIAIAGGGDSAVDWALNLAERSKKIYFIHRRDQFRAAPENVEKLKTCVEQGKVEWVIPYQLQAISGTPGQIIQLGVRSLDNAGKILNVDALLAFFGLSMQLGPIAEWGLALERHHILVSAETMACVFSNKNSDLSSKGGSQTQIQAKGGIFAVGDIAHYPGKLKLILTGFAEAALAARSAFQYIHPDQILHFEYSTTQGIERKQ